MFSYLYYITNCVENEKDDISRLHYRNSVHMADSYCEPRMYDYVQYDIDWANMISIHAPIIYEYDSTFLYRYGLIGSHVVPISHSALSGLDNGPLFERERSGV